jgi:hypothetical protein
MKLTRQQLRSVISDVVGEVSRPRHTAGRNPATGFGIAKDKKAISSLADLVASIIDDQLDRVIREHFDVEASVEAIVSDMRAEAEARPMVAWMHLPVDELKKLVEKYLQTRYVMEALSDVTDDIVRKVVVAAEDIALEHGNLEAGELDRPGHERRTRPLKK